MNGGNGVVSSPKSLNNIVTYVVDNETANKQCEMTKLSCSTLSPCNNYCTNDHSYCSSNLDCDGNDCMTDQCIPTDYYAYNISSAQSKLISSGKIMASPLFDGDYLYYGNKLMGTYTIDGYFTVIGSNISIPYKEDMDPGAMYDNFKYLDASDYADIYNEDMHPDMAVGRIQGITSTDVASYIARDIFLSHSLRLASAKMLASSFDYEIHTAENWTQTFNYSRYNATCNILPTATSGTDFNCKIEENTTLWPNEYKNKGLVQYLDHGAPNWAGINSNQIPYLSNTLLFNDACSTCSTYDDQSFCSNAIRRGALLHAGAASIAWTGNNVYMNMVNGIYYDNLTLGQAFSKSFEYNYYRYMTMILGDPTLNINAQPEIISPLEQQW